MSTPSRPAPRHAELAVNLAGTITAFLLEILETAKTPRHHCATPRLLPTRAPSHLAGGFPRLARRTIQLLACFLLCASSAARGQIVHFDGYADLTFVLAWDKVAVFAERVSGRTTEELFALDARNGALLWRQPVGSVRGDATVGPNGTFYLVAKDQLQERSLATGKPLWQHALDKIPEQKMPPPFKIRDRAYEALAWVALGPGKPVSFPVHLAGSPSWYVYGQPVLSGGKLLVFREANSGGGCVVERCFEDWLLFDATTGKFERGGDGQFAAKAGGVWLIHNHEGWWHFQNGQVRPLTALDELAHCFPRGLMGAGPEEERWSLGDRCLLELEGQNGPELAIFNATTKKVSAFPAPSTRTNQQSSWVLMPSHLLRYAQCPRWGSTGPPPKGRPWFELYDLQGRCLRAAEIPSPPPLDDYYWVQFLGRTTNAITVQTDQARYQVELPSLRITRLNGRVVDSPAGSTTETRRLGARTYSLQGNITVEHLQRNSLPHELVVEAIETSSNRVLWRHTERVDIRKTGAGAD